MDENFDQQEIPTEDSILTKEEQLDELQSSQKNLFLIIFQVIEWVHVIHCTHLFAFHVLSAEINYFIINSLVKVLFLFVSCSPLNY